ncbi:MAG: S9 family peptidase [Gemmataceae bacterium]
MTMFTSQRRHSGVGCLLSLGMILLMASPVVAQEKWTPLHVAKLKTVASAAISPDGSHIAYTLSVPRDLTKQKDGPSFVELHLFNVKANKSVPVVTGEVSVRSVSWTPNGKYIAFLQKKKDDKKTKLFWVSPKKLKKFQTFEHKTSVLSYSFAPDTKKVAFLAVDDPSPKEKALDEKGFTQEIYEEDLRNVKVWVSPLTNPKKATAFKLPGSASDLSWSPAMEKPAKKKGTKKGKKNPGMVDPGKLALALAPTPLVDDKYMFRKVRVVDAKYGQILQKIENPGKMGPLAWSPDGKYLALVAGVDKYDPREGRLWVAPANGYFWTDVLPKYNGHIADVAWKNGHTIIYLGNEGVYTEIGAVEISIDKNNKLVGRKPQTIVPAKGPIITSMSVADDGEAFAFVAHTPEHPPELYFMASGAKSPKKVTNHNPWLKDMAFAKQEVVRYKAKDGLMIEGILVYPLGYKKGTRYPLVLNVHGGPEAHVSHGWVTRYAYLGQVGAAEGIASFYPNYRGSTGRGVEFSMLGQADAAGKEFDDLVDGVDHLIKIGLADKNKVGVTGGSYGGYATAWCTTYFSDRFAAGVMFVGISDNVSKVGTTDIPWEMYLVHHRKWLWEDYDYFLKRSPIYHLKKAKTPLLIMHGKNDPRVHPGQSIELFRNLKLRNKAPVRLVFYPGEGHGNRRAASRLDYNYRLVRWMKHFLEGKNSSPPPTKVNYGLGNAK